MELVLASHPSISLNRVMHFPPAKLIRGACVHVVWLLISILLATHAQAAPPTLSHIFPAGGQRGCQTMVTCSGEFTWPVQVWAPGVKVCVTEEEGKLQVDIPQDLATDRVWIRLYNEEGASAALPFLIGSLHELSEEEPNNWPREAQPLSQEAVTVNGILKEKEDVDGFAMELKAGQTLVAHVAANSRLGSPMDAVLQVVTPGGAVLAENHDAVGLDPRIVYTAEAAGTHIVRLFAFSSTPNTKIAFQNGEDYIYRLTLTTGPFITHAVPLAAPSTDMNSVNLLGWNIPSRVNLPVVPLGKGGLESYPEIEGASDFRHAHDSRLGFAFAPEFAGSARTLLVPHRVTREITQADPHEPPVIELPSSITGRLRLPGRSDVFRLPLRKKQAVVIAVEAPSLDLPMVPVVRLIDPTGGVAAEVLESGPARDAVIFHRTKHEGEYRLTITDRYRHGGERYFYRLTIREDVPDYELVAENDTLVVEPGKPAEFPMKIKRHAVGKQSIGPITLKLVDPPHGLSMPQVVSEAEGDTAKKVNLKFSAKGPAFSGLIHIRGTAEQPSPMERHVRAPEKFGASTDAIWLTVTEPDSAEPDSAEPDSAEPDSAEPGSAEPGSAAAGDAAAEKTEPAEKPESSS